jgi:hypothetical protein
VKDHWIWATRTTDFAFTSRWCSIAYRNRNDVGAPVQSQFIDQLDDTERGIGFGLVRTVYLLIGAVGSSVIGIVVTQTSWAVGFNLLASLLGLCLALVSIRTFLTQSLSTKVGE